MARNIDEIHNQILDNIDDEYQKTVGFPAYDITRAFAVVLSALGEDIDNTAAMVDADNLVGEDLEKYVYQHKGIVRRDSVKATGVLTATVSASATIPAGTLFETASGVQFQSTQTVSGSTSLQIPIEAVEGGATGNVAAGTITVIPITITGLAAVSNPDSTAGGYRAETDDELRERYYLALQQPITAGNKYQYQAWALEIDGVGYAKVFPLENGANTVGICIIGNDGKPASAALVAAVQEHIDPASAGVGEGVAPIGAHCTVAAATSKTVNISVKVNIMSGYSSSVIKTEIQNKVDAYFAEIALRQDYVSYAKIGNLILSVDGVEDYSNLLLNSGSANIALTAKQVAVRGAVTMT